MTHKVLGSQFHEWVASGPIDHANPEGSTFEQPHYLPYGPEQAEQARAKAADYYDEDPGDLRPGPSLKVDYRGPAPAEAYPHGEFNAQVEVAQARATRGHVPGAWPSKA